MTYHDDAWDDSAAQAELDELTQHVRWDDTSPESLTRIARYVNLLLDTGMVEEGAAAAGEWFHLLEGAIANNPLGETLLDSLLDWTAVSRRFDVPGTMEFGAWFDFAALYPLLANKPSRWNAALKQRELVLLTDYERWQAQGGKAQTVPAEAQQHLQAVSAKGFEAYKADAHTLLEAGTLAEAALLLRGLITYAAATGKPNDANIARKQLLAILPELPGYTPVDRAPLLLELGTTLVQYRKHAAAIPYLQEAMALAVEAGSQYEALRLQAESWLEAAQAEAKAS